MEDVRKNLTTISIKPDGDKWRVLWGINLQEGIAGSGDSPITAMTDFCKHVLKKEGIQDVTRNLLYKKKI